MKKTIILISVILVSMIASFSIIYKNAKAPKNDAEVIATQMAEKEAGIVEVEKFYLYHGNSLVYTIIGKNKEGEPLTVFIPEDEKQEVMILQKDEGITEQEAINQLISDQGPKEILNVNLGLEEGNPVWELAYLDHDSYLNYYYVYFKTGKWWRTIENL